jgi:hypothetical protein
MVRFAPIASIPCGHSLKDFEVILDAHYLGRDAQLAEWRQSAISINTGW